MTKSFVGIVLMLLVGCSKYIEDQTKKSPNSIIGKKTQDVGKFDPNAKQEVSDSKVRVSADPVTYPLQAYGPMVEQIMKTHVEHAIRLFEAEHGRYPKDYDEFMTEIIKKNNIQLPVLPNNMKYKYDEVNHKLEVVKPPEPVPGADANVPDKPATEPKKE